MIAKIQRCVKTSGALSRIEQALEADDAKWPDDWLGREDSNLKGRCLTTWRLPNDAGNTPVQAAAKIDVNVDAIQCDTLRSPRTRCTRRKESARCTCGAGRRWRRTPPRAGASRTSASASRRAYASHSTSRSTAPASTSLPNTSNITFHNGDGEGIVIALDLAGVAVSTGSACSSGRVEPSHALLAMGLTPSEARATVRFSLSRFTTAEEIDRVVDLLRTLVPRCITA